MPVRVRGRGESAGACPREGGVPVRVRGEGGVPVRVRGEEGVPVRVRGTYAVVCERYALGVIV